MDINRNIEKNQKTLLHLGCMLNYRIPQMAFDLIEILDKLQIDFILDPAEMCCGYYVWNCGDHQSASKVIEKHSKRLEKYDKIICACAGCYTFFRSHYPSELKFVHAIEVISEKIHSFLEIQSDRILKQVKESNRLKRGVFHDSCHLTRPWGITEPPRSILNSLGYEHVQDFPRAKESNLCCGADGGMRFINKKLAIKIGKNRVKEASEISDSLLTLCPFCIFNFNDAKGDDFHSFNIDSLYREIRESLARFE